MKRVLWRCWLLMEILGWQRNASKGHVQIILLIMSIVLWAFRKQERDIMFSIWRWNWAHVAWRRQRCWWTLCRWSLRRLAWRAQNQFVETTQLFANKCLTTLCHCDTRDRPTTTEMRRAKIVRICQAEARQSIFSNIKLLDTPLLTDSKLKRCRNKLIFQISARSKREILWWLRTYMCHSARFATIKRNTWQIM